MMDHLSKDLHSTKMPAIKGKKCANLLIDILRSMKSDKKKIVKKADDPISPAGNQPYKGSEKSKIILSCNTLLVTKGLRVILITQKQTTTISSQYIFKL